MGQEPIASLEIFLDGSKIGAFRRDQILDELPQILSQRRAGLDPLAGSGMRKSEFCSVEKLPAERGKLGLADERLSRSSI
jgi:hypothetical protein